MTTRPLPVPVHAIGDGLPPRVPARTRVRRAARQAAQLAGLGVAVLLLTVDVLPLAVLFTLGALALPVLVHLIRTAEWL